MKDLILYIDQLREGKEELIELSLSPDFLDICESDLQFCSPVSIKGKAYLAESHLILQLSLQVEALVRCAVCNQLTPSPINLPHFTEAKALSEIKGALYNYSGAIREGILLEIPHYVECRGDCLNRVELKNYLEKKNSSQGRLDKARFPFADLN